MGRNVVGAENYDDTVRFLTPECQIFCYQGRDSEVSLEEKKVTVALILDLLCFFRGKGRI